MGGPGRLKNMKIIRTREFLIFLYGRWEDLDRWTWVVIDVGVILDTSASHSENYFSVFWEMSYREGKLTEWGSWYSLSNQRRLFTKLSTRRGPGPGPLTTHTWGMGEVGAPINSSYPVSTRGIGEGYPDLPRRSPRVGR